MPNISLNNNVHKMYSALKSKLSIYKLIFLSSVCYRTIAPDKTGNIAFITFCKTLAGLFADIIYN